MCNLKKENQPIAWLKSKEDVPRWLQEIFNCKLYKERMLALKHINQQSLQVHVVKN
jgi:hypothetical protein